MERELDRIVNEFGLEDSEDLRAALTESFMSGVLRGNLDSDIAREAIDYFLDEEE